MKPSITFLQNCMCWLTEFSVYTHRLNKMRGQLEAIKPELTESKSEHHELMMQDLERCSRKLNTTQRKILYIVNQQLHHCYIPNCDRRFEIANEDELFDEMKYDYDLFLELQRSIIFYLEDYRLPKSKSIEIPYTLKLQHHKYCHLS